MEAGKFKPCLGENLRGRGYALPAWPKDLDIEYQVPVRERAAGIGDLGHRDAGMPL
jgi:hypothetical protein